MTATGKTIALLLCFSASVFAASLEDHPGWRSTSLPDLYYEVLARSVELQAGLQAADGRFRDRLPEPGDMEGGWRITGMQFIYAPALLYVADHPANPVKGDAKVLAMALRAGDYLASVVGPDGTVRPTVDGRPTDPLDAHRTIYCWGEAYGLLEKHLGPERSKTWREALYRAGQAILEQEVVSKIDRPRYTSPFLGFSPNHMGLRSSTVWRLGMLLDQAEWVKTTEPALRKFIAEIRPGGYWEEHDGPTMSYDYLNASVAGLFLHYTGDPEAMRACSLSTDFHAHWSTPDGVDIHTVDQRNRDHFRPAASYGLFAFSHFPEGRRYARFKLLSALGDGDNPLETLGLESLARIAQDAHYHVSGPEQEIPQQLTRYRHSLDRPAVVRKEGPWVHSISALVSPPRPLSQFYLDRIVPISLWHEKTRHIIGGGNSKGQPELATFSVRRADGSHDCLPLDALILGSGEGDDTLCVAHEGFSLSLTISYPDPSTALLRARAVRTYDRPGDIAQLNLPLVLQPGATLTGGKGPITLDQSPVRLHGPDRISCQGWSLTMPEGAVLVWPYYTYSPYGAERVPENIQAAQGVLSLPLNDDARWVEIRIEIQ